MITAVQFFDVVLWIHILAFFIAFGPTYAYGVFFTFAAKAGPQAMIQTARATQAWDRIAISAGSAVILASGIYMAADRWDFADFFVSWGVVAILFVVGMTHGFFVPRSRKVVALLEEGKEQEAQALGDQIGKVGGFVGLVVILTIYVMTAKPFL